MGPLNGITLSCIISNEFLHGLETSFMGIFEGNFPIHSGIYIAIKRVYVVKGEPNVFKYDLFETFVFAV